MHGPLGGCPSKRRARVMVILGGIGFEDLLTVLFVAAARTVTSSRVPIPRRTAARPGAYSPC
jgi:hypothetical protein